MPSQDRGDKRRRLKIDLAELIGAFDSGSHEAAYYLDLETGEVSFVTDEIRQELGEICEDMDPDEDVASIDLRQVAERRGLPEWMADAIEEASRVERNFGTRFVTVPQDDSHEAYRDMEWFIETLADRRLQQQLWQAIEGRGAFRRFRDVLDAHPRLQESWSTFKDARVRARALDWLESEGIEPILDPE